MEEEMIKYIVNVLLPYLCMELTVCEKVNFSLEQAMKA
jgi:hypothetical protein